MRAWAINAFSKWEGYIKVSLVPGVYQPLFRTQKVLSATYLSLIRQQEYLSLIQQLKVLSATYPSLNHLCINSHVYCQHFPSIIPHHKELSITNPTPEGVDYISPEWICIIHFFGWLTGLFCIKLHMFLRTWGYRGYRFFGLMFFLLSDDTLLYEFVWYLCHPFLYCPKMKECTNWYHMNCMIEWTYELAHTKSYKNVHAKEIHDLISFLWQKFIWISIIQFHVNQLIIPICRINTQIYVN